MATGTLQKNMVLLWKNASPSSAFAGQKILLDLTKYSQVIVQVSSYGDQNANALHAIPCWKSKTTYMVTAWEKNSMRTAVVANDGITFGGGGFYGTYNNSATTSNNSFCMPMEIWAIQS